jgi:hypothetical protein
MAKMRFLYKIKCHKIHGKNIKCLETINNWVDENLDDLYETYKKTSKEKTVDEICRASYKQI